MSDLALVYYVEELSPAERDRLLMLMLDRMHVEIVARKFDGQSEREIELRSKEPRP